jgi:hypothetical protein
MFLVDKRGRRPVCASCRRLGPYMDEVTDVFVCEACVRAAEDYIRRLAERLPELRDHRLKRWRSECDCQRCRRRGHVAV